MFSLHDKKLIFGQTNDNQNGTYCASFNVDSESNNVCTNFRILKDADRRVIFVVSKLCKSIRLDTISLNPSFLIRFLMIPLGLMISFWLLSMTITRTPAFLALYIVPLLARKKSLEYMRLIMIMHQLKYLFIWVSHKSLNNCRSEEQVAHRMATLFYM